ncbi:MAG: alpha-galactosidase, partial [Lentisphaeria bacterium]|nr:alpha-galactosidase [Lentisphaeria bacterium]
MDICQTGSRFLLTNRAMSYGIEISPEGMAHNIYWGKPLESAEDLEALFLRQCHRHLYTSFAKMQFQELPVFGGDFFDETALKITYADRIRVSRFEYTGFEKEANKLVLFFKEKRHDVLLELVYILHEEILERAFRLVNKTDQPLTLERFASGAWYMPQYTQNWRLTHWAGHWAKEAQPCRQTLTPGKFVIESRTGVTGPFHYPLAAMDDHTATESTGTVYFCSVMWSGNWKITAERNAYESAALICGINDFDSAFEVAPGECFESALTASGVSADGFGGMSRILHRWQKQELLPPRFREKNLPMLCNTWGSLETNVNEENVLATARVAARAGCELFVIDDGWQTALGDWYPDKEKFPRGLKPVIDGVAELGMQFGLWIEPESFEIKSALYREHPEWAMTWEGVEPGVRRHGPARTNILLDLARKDVAEYIYNAIRELVRSTGISYLKLDMNSYFTTPGASPRLWIDYARNLDDIFARLLLEFPDLLLENCASGAARASLQMTKSFARMNRSDNQDALDMLKLHEGFTAMNLPRMAGGACHISDSMRFINKRITPMKYQAYCGMMGSLACGKALNRCSEEEILQIREYTDLYKLLRPVVHQGEFYRLA